MDRGPTQDLDAPSCPSSRKDQPRPQAPAGTQFVETTLADLKTLISVIDDTASAVQEQAIASDEIARNMDAVQRIAGSVVNSSESAVTEGERLQNLAEALEQSVRGFKIDPERVALDEAELKALPEHRA